MPIKPFALWACVLFVFQVQMSRKIRNSLLESRSNRLRLPVARKPAFVRVAPGISLGYRRNQAAGTWVVRVADGRGGSWTKAIGFADDHDEADGHRFFDYWQAQEQAKTVARRKSGAPGAEPVTVRSAAETYLDWLTAKNRRTAADTKGRLNRHFLPKFGDRLTIGFADDHDEADGHRFFDYWQAQEQAKTVARREFGAPGAEPVTVRSAADTYLDWLTAKNRRTAADTRAASIVIFFRSLAIG